MGLTDKSARLVLVERNTTEIVTRGELEDLLGQNFRFYLGIAPTGPAHIGYLIPLAKVVDCVRAGGAGTILIADYHAYLDDRKTPWDKMQARSAYYQKCLELALGDHRDSLRFVRGSEFQTNADYAQDLFRLASVTTVKRATRAAAGVCRLKEPKVSEMIYPIMQTLDVRHLDAQLVIGGTDQRHVYMLARELLPELNLSAPVCVFTPLLTSLKGPGQKMSASVPGTHIKMHESEEELTRLIRTAYCPAKSIDQNPVIDICKHIIFPLRLCLADYERLEDLESAFINGSLHPADLKAAVTQALWDIIKPVSEFVQRNPAIELA